MGYVYGRPRLLLLVAVALAVSLGSVGVEALTAREWRKQSIYQVMVDRFARTDLSTTAQCDTSRQAYCGGTWRGLISKLDYIQGMGFTAVWISPVTRQINGESRDGSSYHGYWAQDIWSLNPDFGNAADLVALSAALHARNMYLMLDVVTNHMAHHGCRNCVDYSRLSPFSESSYYHPPCPINYSNQSSVEVCWQGTDTVSLPDLRTSREDVRRIWNGWVSSMVSRYSIDGVRIDSAKHVEPSFWAGFQDAAGVYLLGEVFSGDPAYVVPYQQFMDGLLDYPCYYWITRAFQSPGGSISELVRGLSTLKDTALDTSLYGSFLENHDIERFASLTSDLSLAKNAIAFMMLKDGIPVIYQGQEQGFAGGPTPSNREALWLSGYSTFSDMYGWIAKLNQIRTWVAAQDPRHLVYRGFTVYSNSNTIVMRKGHTGYQVISIYSNIGSRSTVTLTLPSSQTSFEPGQKLVDVLNCTFFTASSNGSITLILSQGLPRVLYPMTRLSGSSMCPGLEVDVPSTATATPTATPTNISSSTGSSTLPCSATTVPILFEVLAQTALGDTIKLVGNVSALGSWNAGNAVTLSASRYTSAKPVWWGYVQLPPGAVIAFKYINVSSSGTVTWQAGTDRTYTVGCASDTVSNTWQV